MHQINLQKTFDTVYIHLLKQGKKAERKTPDGKPFACQYLADDGLKCAVGCLIPEENYTPKIEGLSVHSLFFTSIHDPDHKEHNLLTNILCKSLGVPYLTKNDIQFLADLQNIHDQRDPEFWPSELKRLADKHTLSIPSVA